MKIAKEGRTLNINFQICTESV